MYFKCSSFILTETILGSTSITSSIETWNVSNPSHSRHVWPLSLLVVVEKGTRCELRTRGIVQQKSCIIQDPQPNVNIYIYVLLLV